MNVVVLFVLCLFDFKITDILTPIIPCLFVHVQCTVFVEFRGERIYVQAYTYAMYRCFIKVSMQQ